MSFSAFIFFATASAWAGTNEFESCAHDLLSREAVQRHVAEASAVLPSMQTVMLAAMAGYAEEKIVTTATAAVTGRSTADARDAYMRLKQRLDVELALTRFPLNEARISEVLIMSFDANLTVDQMVERLVAMAHALGRRVETAEVLFTLVKISLHYDRTTDEVIGVLDQVRRGAPAVEGRVRDAHAAVIARHAKSALDRPGAWLTDELQMAVVESALASQGPSAVDTALAAAEEVLSHEVAALYSGPEQEAMIKSRAVLGTPLRASLEQLAEFEARTLARFGEHFDKSIEPLLVYAMLLGQRRAVDVINFVDHLVAADEGHLGLLGVTVIARTNFALVKEAPHPTLLRSAQFNAFH